MTPQRHRFDNLILQINRIEAQLTVENCDQLTDVTMRMRRIASHYYWVYVRPAVTVESTDNISGSDERGNFKTVS